MSQFKKLRDRLLKKILAQCSTVELGSWYGRKKNHTEISPQHRSTSRSIYDRRYSSMGEYGHVPY